MKAVIKSMDRKEKTERAPLLYDLTSLQRDANRILGFTVQQTLDYIQILYEKKLVTYLRTDSRYLTEDMKPKLPSIISQVAEKIGVDASVLKSDDKTEISVDIMCDSRKVSDHHAIIQTQTMCAANLAEISSGKKAILQLIAVRLLCAVARDYRYAEDTIVLTCGGEEFSKKIKMVLFGATKLSGRISIRSRIRKRRPIPARTFRRMQLFLYPRQKSKKEKQLHRSVSPRIPSSLLWRLPVPRISRYPGRR